MPPTASLSYNNQYNTKCHAPLPKIYNSGDATRVGDAYKHGKYPAYMR